MRSFIISAVALLATASATSNSPTVNPANYDGECFYPVGDPYFPSCNLREYTGRWYQVAGTSAPFTAGCTCIYADYGLNSNGTIDVRNFCQRGSQSSNIRGTASPVNRAYGPAALQVRFESIPGGGVSCPGPNYIVQKYDPQYAIVQAPSWGTLFILSREQKPSNASIEAWIDEAVALGSNRTAISLVSQDNCVDQ